MHKVWNQFGKWFKCKASVRYTRMRNLKSRIVDHLASIKEDVNIDDACIPFNVSHASHRSFNGVDTIEQFIGFKWSADLNDLIEKVRLIRIAPRCGTIA